MSNPRNALTAAIAVIGAFSGRVERLPRDCGGVVDPRFFRRGIAAGGMSLLDHGAACLAQPRVDLVQLDLAFHLDAEMVEAGLLAARGDGEIDARIIEHPFGVIRFHHGWRRCEQRRIEADGSLEIFNTYMEVPSFFGGDLLIRQEAARGRCGASSFRSSREPGPGSAVP